MNIVLLPACKPYTDLSVTSAGIMQAQIGGSTRSYTDFTCLSRYAATHHTTQSAARRATKLLCISGLTQIEPLDTTYSVMVGYAHPTNRGYA